MARVIMYFKKELLIFDSVHQDAVPRHEEKGNDAFIISNKPRRSAVAQNLARQFFFFL